MNRFQQAAEWICFLLSKNEPPTCMVMNEDCVLVETRDDNHVVEWMFFDDDGAERTEYSNGEITSMMECRP